MIKKIINKNHLKNFSEIKENYLYWQSKTPDERVSAVESLRRQYIGSTTRLQRTVRVIKKT